MDVPREREENIRILGRLNMKHKFKIGDKVRIIDCSNIKNYTGGWYKYMNKYVGKVCTIVKVYTLQDGRTSYALEHFMMKFDERGLVLAEDKGKFKVGDMIIGNSYASGTYGITKSGWKGRVVSVNVDGTFDAIGIGITDTQTFHRLLPVCFDLLETKVVITYVENMTIAKCYENGNCTRTGVAKCSPEDTFSEETGAKIALERLFAESFDWESFKKGEICVLCNKDNYKDFLKAAKEHNIKSKYKDTWDKLVLFDETHKQIKMFCGAMSRYEEELLPDDKAGFKVVNGRMTLMIFNPDKDDKVVEW